MRVLHVLDHSLPLHSGYTFRTQAILREQRSLGWEPILISGPRQGSTSALVEEVGEWRFYRTPVPQWLGSRLPVAQHAADIGAITRRLQEVIRETQPAIIHAHSPALNGEAALRAGRTTGLPVLYEVRAFWEDAAADHGTTREGGIRYRATRILENRVLRQAEAVTTICQGLKVAIRERGISPEKITVIPNGVDPEQFRMSSAPDPVLAHELGLEGQVVLGFIGSFYAYEGLDLLIRALPALLEQNPNIRALLVGGGPERENLEGLARSLGVREAVVFTGRVPHEAIQSYYDLVDLFVYPRRSMRLTELVTPLKPLEAMAQGRLVLASDVGGHQELIRPGETGWLFSADAVDGLREAVAELLQSRECWPAIQKAAREFVERERTWSVSVARYKPVYTALAGRTEKEEEYV